LAGVGKRDSAGYKKKPGEKKKWVKKKRQGVVGGANGGTGGRGPRD